MNSRRSAFLLFAALATSPLLFAQEKHLATTEEILSLKLLNSPRISPDGKFVAYRVRETNWKDNEFISQLWLVYVSTGDKFQLTRGKKSAGSADWSPDGRWIAFVTEREPNAVEPPKPDEKKDAKKDEKKEESKDAKEAEHGEGKPAAHQIWLISPQGGEAWQLTKSETDVGDFHWSKDSKSIAFIANPAESKANKDRKEKFSDYMVYEKDYGMNQLWLVDVVAAAKNSLPAAAKQLTTDLALNIDSFAWSPDSSRIAFSASHSPLLAFNAEQDLYLLDLAHGNSVSKIVALPGPDRDPIFSPDGKQLAFSTALGEKYFYYSNGQIALVDLDAVQSKPATLPADVKDLTAKFDEDAQPIDWGPDGIYFVAQQKTNGHAFRLNPSTSTIERITKPDSFQGGDISFTPDCKYFAYTADDATHMDELFVSTTSNFAPKQLTDMTAQVKDWKLGTVEVISWKSQDGAVIEGVLHQPADFDPSRKYPLLVHIHGGPTGVSQPSLSPADYAYPLQAFLSQGAIVLDPNYRGSAGYGAAFRKLNVRHRPRLHLPLLRWIEFAGAVERRVFGYGLVPKSFAFSVPHARYLITRSRSSFS